MYIASKCLFGPAEVPGAAELNAAELKRIREAYSLRRADRYTALVVGAAVRAAQGVEVAGTGTALVTATAFGPHRTTFATLDDILDYPEDQILPTRFSHSVHNAAASYVGVALQIQGPTLALAGFEPLASVCAVCGREAPEAPMLDVLRGVVHCGGCKQPGGLSMPLTAAGLAALRHILYCDSRRLYAFTLEPAALRELDHAGEAFAASQLERSFRTLDYYKSVLG